MNFIDTVQHNLLMFVVEEQPVDPLVPIPESSNNQPPPSDVETVQGEGEAPLDVSNLKTGVKVLRSGQYVTYYDADYG